MNEREVINYWNGRCFGCSPTNPHGLKLHLWYSEHGCFTRYRVPDYLCGIDGLAHGGIIALLIDEVSEWTLIALLGRFGVTTDMTIRYLNPAEINTEIIVEGQIVSHDDRNAILHTTVHSVEGKLLTEGQSQWMFPSLSSLAKIGKVDESILREFLAHYPQ
jgi:acyl-CoA thioesterase FadM